MAFMSCRPAVCGTLLLLYINKLIYNIFDIPTQSSSAFHVKQFPIACPLGQLTHCKSPAGSESSVHVAKAKPRTKAKERRPVNLEWTEICLEAKQTGLTKKILQNCSGAANSGQLVALMGPSGPPSEILPTTSDLFLELFFDIFCQPGCVCCLGTPISMFVCMHVGLSIFVLVSDWTPQVDVLKEVPFCTNLPYSLGCYLYLTQRRSHRGDSLRKGARACP